jgi:hypothetical protein
MMNNLVFRPTMALMLSSIFFLSGCAASFDGIRFRAQDPPINEAFKKIALAVSVDGYAVRRIDPRRFVLESEWRELHAKEKSPTESILPSLAGRVEGRVVITLYQRGMLYDVECAPIVRTSQADSGAVVGINHPLREKWEIALKRLLSKEVREED